jgi:putative transposase
MPLTGETLMPRKGRHAPAGYPYHVTNRGNDRRRIFYTEGDYRKFLRLLEIAKARYPVKVFGICIMPNHFHGLMQPLVDGALSAYLQWVLGQYGSGFRCQTRTVGHGHVFKGRFWNDGIADERHFLAVLRYIEANPSEADLVARAETWPWSSLVMRRAAGHQLLDPLPLVLPLNWVDVVNSPQPYEEIERIEHPRSRRSGQAGHTEQSPVTEVTESRRLVARDCLT